MVTFCNENDTFMYACTSIYYVWNIYNRDFVKEIVISGPLALALAHVGVAVAAARRIAALDKGWGLDLDGKRTSMFEMFAVGALADIVRLELESIGRPGADNVLANRRVDVGDIRALLDPVVRSVGQGKVIVESKCKRAFGVAEVKSTDKDLVLVLGGVFVCVSVELMVSAPEVRSRNPTTYLGGKRPSNCFMPSSTCSGSSLGHWAVLLATLNL